MSPSSFLHTYMVSGIAVEQSQFNISHLFTRIVCSIWPIDLSDATTLSQSGPGNDGNEEYPHIQSGYSTTPANSAEKIIVIILVKSLNSWGVFYILKCMTLKCVSVSKKSIRLINWC